MLPTLAAALLTVLGIGSAAVPESASAQLRGCDAKDARCLDEAYAAPCLAETEPWPAACEALLAELTRFSEIGSEPEVLAQAALIHRLLADAAGAAADSAAHMEAARQFYRRVLTLDPGRTRAYVGLASLTDDLAERIAWLRRAHGVEPAHSGTAHMLASALEELDTREALLEAAAVMRTAYEASPVGRQNWRLARSTIWLYTRLGLDAEARDIRDKVRAEMDIGGHLDGLSYAADEPEAALASLRMLCDSTTIDIVGPTPCIDGVGLLLGAARGVDDVSLSRRLVQAGLGYIERMPSTPSQRIDRSAEILGWLEALAAAGHDSPQLFFSIGRCQLDLGGNAEALAALAKARPAPNAYWDSEIDRYEAMARGEAARDRSVCVRQVYVME